MKQDDIFYCIGFLICVFFLYRGFDCSAIVGLVLGHKGISVIDDKVTDKQRPIRPD